VSVSKPDGPVVVVDPYSSGALLAPQFAARGVPVVAVLSTSQPPEVFASSYSANDFARTIRSDGELEPVVRQVAELRPRCVLAGCDLGVPLADALATQVTPDVANVPGLSMARWHKGAMAAAAARAGQPVMEQICTSSPADVEAWLVDRGLVGRDLVVKPANSSGTDSVTRVPAGAPWRPVFDLLLGSVNQHDLVNDEVLVQEYLTGTEYVVDTVSVDGRHTVASAGRYRKVDNGPHMAVYESMEWLSPDCPEVPGLISYTAGILDAIGLRHGAAHCEIMLTADGWRVVEVGARMHGGKHSLFCRQANGDSQLDRIVALHSTSRVQPESGFRLRRPTTLAFLLARAAGTVHGVGELGRLRELPSFVDLAVGVADGDRVTLSRDLTNLLGYVVLSHPDPARLATDLAVVREVETRLVRE
jgi:hypothetical protein